MVCSISTGPGPGAGPLQSNIASVRSLLSSVCSSSEKLLEVSSASRYRELANAPVSIASGFPDKGSGMPWLVSGVGWEDVPVCCGICWEDGPAGSDWEAVPVVASSPVKEMVP